MSKNPPKGSFREPPAELAKRLAHKHDSHKSAGSARAPAKRAAKRRCPAFHLNQGLFERAGG